MIEKLSQQKKTWHDVDRTAQIGDLVTINFSGVCEGETLPTVRLRIIWSKLEQSK